MRQLFYLLMTLNLLLFLWIYQSEQQPDQLQIGHPAIGDLHIVSDDVILQIKSDAMIDGEMEQEAVLQVEQEPLLQAQKKPLSLPLYLTPGVDETHARSAKPDAISAPLKHSSSRKIVTSINGYEVVLFSLISYHAVVRIFDQLQPSAGVEVDTSVRCGDEKCRFFDVSHYLDDAEKGLFDAAHFIERDSAMMQKAVSGIDAADAHSADE